MILLLVVINGCGPSLREAARKNDVGRINVLLQQGHRTDETYMDDFGFGYTPLHYAAANGSIKASELLLARGADINARGKEGITPLHTACGVLTPLRPGDGSSEAAIYLINRGADVSMADGFGLTPIHYAAAHGRLDVIKILLKKGIDINVGNKKVGTPLHYAFPFARPLQKYSLTTAEFLLKEGADINATVSSGETPLYNVARMGNCEWVRFLIEHGADVNQPAKNGETPLSYIKKNCGEEWGRPPTVAQAAEAPHPADRENRGAALAKQSEAADETPSLTSETLGAKFIRVPAGTFMMGGPGFGEMPLHQVTISKPFYLQETELTQGQWRKIMERNPSYFKDCGDDCPVEQVSWNDVQGFIRKLNQQEGRDKYRLPTEAEWEYAARSGGRQEEYAGTDSESDLREYAWYTHRLLPSYWKTHPVRQKKPNGFGLYDMSGNVIEWVQDWYGTYPSGSVVDPVGPASGSNRIFRGGDFNYGSIYCRTAFRGANAPDFGSKGTGFRLVMMP